MGAGFCVHVDGEKGVVCSVALPAEWQGGLFRVCLQPGENAINFRRGGLSIADVVPKMAGNLHHVPMDMYGGVVLHGVAHFHEVSEISHGTRFSLVIGFNFKSCQPGL